jgi:hypothetical protein
MRLRWNHIKKETILTIWLGHMSLKKYNEYKNQNSNNIISPHIPFAFIYKLSHLKHFPPSMVLPLLPLPYVFLPIDPFITTLAFALSCKILSRVCVSISPTKHALPTLLSLHPLSLIDIAIRVSLDSNALYLTIYELALIHLLH